MAKSLFTPEQEAFIREAAKGRTTKELKEIVNEIFDISMTVPRMKAYKSNHGISSGMTRQEIADKTEHATILTEEQDEFLRECAPGVHNKDLLAYFNEQFGMVLTLKQLTTYKKNHGIRSGLKGTEGMPPPNKGKKCPNQRNSGNFKPGNTPMNHREVGSARTDTDGYTVMKVAEPNKWQPAHVLVWEKHHGKVPKGHCLVFKDRDKTNWRIDNLLLISRAQLAVMNKQGLIKDDPDLTETGALVAEVEVKVSRLKQRRGKA